MKQCFLSLGDLYRDKKWNDLLLDHIGMSNVTFFHRRYSMIFFVSSLVRLYSFDSNCQESMGRAQVSFKSE